MNEYFSLQFSHDIEHRDDSSNNRFASATDLAYFLGTDSLGHDHHDKDAYVDWRVAWLLPLTEQLTVSFAYINMDIAASRCAALCREPWLVGITRSF